MADEKVGTFTQVYKDNITQLSNRLTGGRIITGFLFLGIVILLWYIDIVDISDKIDIFIGHIITFSTISLVVFPNVLTFWLKYQPNILKLSDFKNRIQSHTKVSKMICDQLTQVFIIVPFCFIVILVPNITIKKVLITIILWALFGLIRQLYGFIYLSLLDYVRIESQYDDYDKSMSENKI